MISRFGGTDQCRLHRATLLAVDDGEDVDYTDLAWQHVEWCTNCRRELESVEQTIVALRRVGKEVALTEPPGDPWPRLRDRVTSLPRAERWTPRLSLGGLAVAAALVALLVVPTTFVPGPVGRFEESLGPGAASRHVDRADRIAEAHWLRAAQAGAADTTASSTTADSFIFDQRRFGETILVPPYAAPKAKLR